MKIRFAIQNQTGSALMLVLIMSAIALAILAGAMTWAASSNKLTHRSIQYTRSVAAAEAATEKAESQITRDFLSGGEKLVSDNLNSYKTNLPTSADSSYWNTWVFDDGNGNLNQTYVQFTGTNTIELNPPYSGLKGYVTTYTVVSHARDTASPQDVNAGVLEQLQLAGIPIFQFGMYSSDDMEISCGHTFTITGHVHSNGQLYIEPDASLIFESDVTAVGDISFERDPAEGPVRGGPAGSVDYAQTNEVVAHVQALTLPIGTTNTPEAIREIIEPPPSGEDPKSALGLLRYYNQCDMILTVSDTNVVATSGRFNNFGTSVTNTEVALFVSTNNSFWDAREQKTVLPIDIDIGSLTTWSETNSDLRQVLAMANGPSYIMNSIYIVDNRTPSGNLYAVRVFNGATISQNGLTVAAGRPLYVWKDYNTEDYPASLVADAITFLSDGWTDDANKTANDNPASSTTVNAALLTGVVETTLNQYSGGMENFPRFLEDWLKATSTYNGSMIKMFPSLYATNFWKGVNMNVTYYVPPTRIWSYDTNFDDPTKLPPLTPQLLKVIRGQWATVPAGTNAVAATP